MRFTLVYDGPLPAQSADSRLRDKHAIREKFHEQLRELWETTPVLRVDWRKWRALSQTERAELTESRPRSKSTLVQEFVVGRFSFVPLVTKVHRLLAELDILFLRREPTGSLFTTNKAGDLDNRLKVLFDALRLPRDPKEIGDASLQPPNDSARSFVCSKTMT
jgi:hypothetical protein